MSRSARYGGAEGDEAPSAGATTLRHYGDNAIVEDMSVEAALTLGKDWWQAGIAGCLRYIIRRCEKRVKAAGKCCPAKLESLWIPFAEFVELCTSLEEAGDVVYMGETLTEFQHAYGKPETRTRFLQHILPRATEAAKLLGIK